MRCRNIERWKREKQKEREGEIVGEIKRRGDREIKREEREK
jgi:hypothetical protein